MRMKLWLAGIAIAALASPALAAPAPVDIDTGPIVGAVDDGVGVWRAIPFAAPPVGPLRWKPPAPAQPWANPRPAATTGPNCAQVVRGPGPNGGGVSSKGEEDCLTLQVFAPAKVRQAPVMVWIHGGANTMGAGSLTGYDGSAFAKDGVVLVEINYRLGPFGFFAHPALTKAAAPQELLANYGLMDQIAALQWVQRNIKAFGGDPRNVTIFGESAGGEDILALLSMPSTTGLFAKAIVESGVGWEDPVTLAQAETAGGTLAAKAGAPAEPTPDQLRALSVEALVGATTGTGRVVDGKLLPETPAQAFARGHAHDVPLMIGSNSWEASLISGYASTPTGAAAFLARQPDTLKAAYAGLGLDATGEAYAIFTDGVMGAPARWYARKAAPGAPSWLYYFSFVPAATRGALPGSGHASEIRYVFDSWDKSGGPAPDAETRALTKTMHACWVSFAKNSRPEKCAPGGWPAYDPVKDQLMEFGVTSGVRTNFKKPLLDAQEAAKADLISGK